MNKITIIGNLTSDAKIVTFQNGEIAELSVAVNEPGYTTRSGVAVQPSVEYFTCIARGGLVKVAQGWCKKGTKVAIQGKVKSRKYTDKNNIERVVWNIIVEELELCGGKPSAAPAPAPAVLASQVSEAAQSIQSAFGGQWQQATEESMPF
jgi:single stranded DNA-binding protein (ssb)